MRKHLFLAVSCVIAMVFASCSKDMTALDPNNFKCNPNPLEVKGGKIDATITGTFPEKYFTKNATVTVTPVLKYNGKETQGAPAVFQGEKVVGNNQTIAFKTGGSYTMKASFKYVPEMAQSELYLTFSVETKKKTYQIPSIKVADGTITTSQLVGKDVNELKPVLLADRFQHIIQQQQEADILFLIQQSSLRTTELKSKEMLNLVQKIKDAKDKNDKTASTIEVASYASPDGGLELNTNLAEKREAATVNYVSSELKKIKSSLKIDKKFTAEDWDGFQKLLEKSNIQDKQLILRVLSMYSDPEQREREIRNISTAFKAIADEILPKLRRSRLKLTVDVTGKSDEEIIKTAKEDPSKLNADELLYAASLSNNVDEKTALYKKATNLFPKDERAFNNLGVLKLQANKLDEANRMFTKALEINPKSADVNYNAGLAAYQKNQMSKADEFFGKAANTKGDLNRALGSLYISKGNYSKASYYFSTTPSNNAALAKIMTRNYTAARKILTSIPEPNATTYYLSAIIGARTNDREAVFANLKSAVQENSEFAQKAAKDIEFSKFATDEAFLSIVK